MALAIMSDPKPVIPDRGLHVPKQMFTMIPKGVSITHQVADAIALLI